MFRILTVCTGNICRSPLAESILRLDLDPEIFTISSAGIMAVQGGRVPAPQVRIGKSVGVSDLEQHRAQQITVGKIGISDLVLGLSRGHRKRIARLEPTSVKKLFTMREFAHIAQHVTPDDIEEQLAGSPSPLHAAVAAVNAKRGMISPPLMGEEQDVVDPFRKSRSVYKQSRDELVPATEVTAAFLAGVVDVFGSWKALPEPRVLTEPDIVSQGIPKVPNFPKRAELRRLGLLQ